ncbi:LysR family transcriptional regulator [Mangrovitalea sediminis]|uniref:LysR family transcriptional regulator n=1 Tax=Mangrovitalea sediminis TaxID=1982043 RepID=UPI000BE53C74|nr:LysR family transcriptional regulator [Mangrovitalea sediminis]
MDKFASLNAFRQVVESGSFAQAARELGLSRSQVNRLVINLEDDLGVSLLVRTTRHVGLTPAGQAFYERARSILNELSEAEHQIQSDQEEPQGDIKINAPMSFGILHLGPALIDFMKRYPRIRVHLALNDHFVDPVSEGFDITVRIAEHREQPSLIDHEIVEVKRILCAAPDFLAEHGTPAAIQDLSALPCLHYGNLLAGGSWHLFGPEGSVQVRVNGVLCSNNAEVLRDAAINGLGVALLPTFIVGPELQTGRLVSVLPDYHAQPIYLRMIYAPNRHLSARIRLLVKFVQARFGDRPYWDLVE